MLYRHYYLTVNTTGTQMVPISSVSVKQCTLYKGTKIREDNSSPKNSKVKLQHRGGVRQIRKLWDTDPE